MLTKKGNNSIPELDAEGLVLYLICLFHFIITHYFENKCPSTFIVALNIKP